MENNIDNENNEKTTKTDNDLSELSQLKKESVKNNTNNKKRKYGDYRDVIANMSDEQIKQAIRDYEPTPILDWPKIPYKSICVIFLLFFSSILFIYMGIKQFRENEKWYHWFSYLFLGVLLFIPGIFYLVILINILLGVQGYRYEDIPDLSDQ